MQKLSFNLRIVQGHGFFIGAALTVEIRTKIYKQTAMQTPFMKSGEIYSIMIELQDPKVHAIEFVLKDGMHDRWLKLNRGNFQIEIPECDATTSHLSIPKDLIERHAYLLWEKKGRPMRSQQQQKKDYDDALRELQFQLSNGISVNELQSSFQTASPITLAINKEQPSRIQNSYCRKCDVSQWLLKHSEGDSKSTTFPFSDLMNVVEKSLGGDEVILHQSYHVGSYEIAVLLKIVNGDLHVLVAANMKAVAVLHWGISKMSPGEWLSPPQDMLPEKSKLLDGACQTYFKAISTDRGFFQFVDINLQQRNFVGVQFVIWSGGSWIKNKGAKFFVGLKTENPSTKVEVSGKDTVKWLLDEISRREKEAERSLMHRFNIAAELTERCKSEGELGLVGILVWLRFMACRQLTWNKNYNVKPREISEAQDKFTNLLQRIYSSQSNVRELVRLILGCVGRGGQGDAGQRIRDEILLVQRSNDCKGGMMEEWHQKLHNNSSPDDVIICQALLNYVRSGFKIDAYWQTLNANGLTKGILASYDRPIVSEPHFRANTKEGLIRDLTSYLKTLKAVHSGIDLGFSIETCLELSSKGHNFMSATSGAFDGGLSLKLQDYLCFVRVHLGDKKIGPLMEKLLDSRIELRPLLLASHGRLKDLLFLDLALDSTVRTTMERGLKDLNFEHLPEVLYFISLVLENLCLSSVNNEGLICCLKDWYHVCESYKPKDIQWALQTKAVLDRIQLALSDRSQYYQRMIQPSVQYLGTLLVVEKWAIDIFTEELVRAGSASTLSLLLNRLDPILRNLANLGCWQVISPAEACGFIFVVNELITTQSNIYKKPTVIVANKVTGEEEIPEGVVAVLTPDMPDILSHVSIRARNNKVCFATCFDLNVLRDLKSKEGRAISIQLKSKNLIISDVSSSSLLFNSFVSPFLPRGVTFRKKIFFGKYAISLEEFTSEMVGAKSCNIKFLRGKVPSWIKVPMSIALPFGVFETVLAESINKDLANKIFCSYKLVHNGDHSKLKVIQEAVLQLKAPSCLVYELKSKMRSSRIPWPGDEGEERWNCAWQAIKKVWASKWNERAYVCCKKANMNHGNLCMAVLIQEIITADYAFVVHTRNPLTGDMSEIYAEIVKGLGETLVGAYAGRALSFITKKGNLKYPTVTSYPSKQIGLYSKRTIIFRSDSNGEDLKGFAGAGLYDSVLMDKAKEVVLHYSNDQMISDENFRVALFSKIAEVGKIIESLYGCAQDIEGVVKDGEVYVVQTRPQV
ncbi:alpha-glucan water dikinase 2 isoform X2 [Malania oleifera]|uniref:alpha-glucan water dikinase 2 isoform X2 n=1 Tax=Malania oleifera TaxID=397392 RepID=UPI0025AEB6FF|nr:alpha-glucan water dikinase 2 isoform X2 [Malania oleifera]XP_057975076.1 alpha-glucan water dikinase 2 isoform X2 [Malania oleifera]